MNPQIHLAERCTEIKIRRRVVYRISAQNQQHLNLAAIDVAHQLAQRFDSIHRVRFEGFGVINGLADIAQRRVHGVPQRVHSGRLFFSHQQQRSSAMCGQVFSCRCCPLRGDRARSCRTLRPGNSSRCRQLTRECLHVGGSQRFAVIRHCAGAGGHAFNHIQSVQFRIESVYDPSRRKFPRVAHMARTAGNEIRVQ